MSLQVTTAYRRQMLPNALTGTSTYVSSTTYDEAGRFDLPTMGNGLVLDRLYYTWTEDNGRLKELRAGIGSPYAAGAHPCTNRQWLKYTYAADALQCTNQLRLIYTDEYGRNQWGADEVLLRRGAEGGDAHGDGQSVMVAGGPPGQHQSDRELRWDGVCQRQAAVQAVGGEALPGGCQRAADNLPLHWAAAGSQPGRFGWVVLLQC